MAKKEQCSIVRCKSRNKDVHARDWCKNHYNSWLKYGDPEKAQSRRAKGSVPKQISVKSLKELGLFNSFDVSRWCIRHGIQSAYLEYRGRELMEVDFTQLTDARWVVLDAKTPGRILQKFRLNDTAGKDSTLKTASAWMESHYDTEMKYLPSLNAAFPAPAVDLILKEIEIIRKIWSPDPTIVAEVPQETYVRAVEEYRVPSKVRANRKVSV